MSYTSKVSIKDTIPTIGKYSIADAFEFVLDIEKSHGSYMSDVLTGKEILDFYTCFASNPLGFNHPKLQDENTLEKLRLAAINNITNSDLYTDLKSEFIVTFMEKAAPPYMKYIFTIAGGALAVENALKASFDWKTKTNHKQGDTLNHELKAMHLKSAFHGRSGYTMSLTNTDPAKTDCFPKFNWPRIDNPYIVFPDEGANHDGLIEREKKALEQAKHAFLAHPNDIACCVVEPIQGEGGDNHFRPEFLRQLQDLCNENDCMFIVDEIQSGMGITGKMWAYEHLGIEPDMLCFGKKSQVCGFVCSDKIDSINDNVFNVSGRINSTWGGNLIDMVRCARYLEIIEEDKLLENAAKMGGLLKSILTEIHRDFLEIISNARGSGLMCAFDVIDVELRNTIRNKCFDEGMLILPCGTNSLRFRPALNIGEDDVNKAGDILRKVISQFTHQ